MPKLLALVLLLFPFPIPESRCGDPIHFATVFWLYTPHIITAPRKLTAEDMLHIPEGALIYIVIGHRCSR